MTQNEQILISIKPILNVKTFDVNYYLIRGKRPLTGFSLETYYVFAHKYDRNYGGWVSRDLLPYDLFNFTCNYTHFFGKSYFYYRLVVGIGAYSYKGSDFNQLEPIVYPTIGFRRLISR